VFSTKFFALIEQQKGINQGGKVVKAGEHSLSGHSIQQHHFQGKLL